MGNWKWWQDRWPLPRIALVATILVVGTAALIFSHDAWPTVLVALVAAGVAYSGVHVQRHFSERQEQFAKQQLTLTQQQEKANTIMQALSFEPVLTGTRTSDGITVRNVGKGTAYDLRATVLGMPDRETGKPRFDAMAVPITDAHLAPGETTECLPTEEQRRASVFPDPQFDVWIVHCGYAMGEPHFHTWCRWTRTEEGDHYKADEPFIFETFARTPLAIRQACLRCRELRAAHSQFASES